MEVSCSSQLYPTIILRYPFVSGSSKLPLKSLRSALSILLSYAVVDLFPSALLGEKTITNIGFAQAFYFEQPVHPELMAMLKEKIRGLIKKAPHFEPIEMTSRSAFEYFNYHKQILRMLQVEELAVPVIPLIRMGAFCDLYLTFPYQGDWSDVAFDLFDVEILPKEDGKYGALIGGTCFFSKEELKTFLRARKSWLKAKPWESAEKNGWLASIENHPILLPKGLEIFLELENLWRSAISSRSDLIEVIGGKKESHFPLYQRFGKGVAEWAMALDDPWGPKDICSIFCNHSQALHLCISSLQFIRKTFSMVELNVEWVFCNGKPIYASTQQWKQEVKCLTEALRACEIDYTTDGEKSFGDHPGVEVRILDAIGEQWAGPFLSLNWGFSRSGSHPSAHSRAAHSIAAIEYSLLGATKRLISLLAELKEKKLPMFLLRGLNGGEVKTA